jgi:hypothetical protein
MEPEWWQLMQRLVSRGLMCWVKPTAGAAASGSAAVVEMQNREKARKGSALRMGEDRMRVASKERDSEAAFSLAFPARFLNLDLRFL